MNGDTAIEKGTLQRIAVVLLSLAAIADLAAGRSRPVRWLVLWLLRPAEAIARAFAAEAGWTAGTFVPVEYPEMETRDGSGDGPGEASRLAQQFRALAAIFRILAHKARSIGCRGIGPHFDPGGSNAVWLHRLLAALEPRYADTS